MTSRDKQLNGYTRLNNHFSTADLPHPPYRFINNTQGKTRILHINSHKNLLQSELKYKLNTTKGTNKLQTQTYKLHAQSTYSNILNNQHKLYLTVTEKKCRTKINTTSKWGKKTPPETTQKKGWWVGK